jgi:integrase
LGFLGKRSRNLIGAVTHKDILGFIESRATAEIASKTISVDVKALNTAFNLARRLGIRTDNPVEKALAIKPMIIQSSEKECFQPNQVSLLLKHATGDWKTMVLLGCFTGARLGDCANMRWANVNFEKCVIDFQPQKTRKNNARVVVPMHPDLENHLMTLASTDTDGFLCPSLAQKGIGGKSGLSEKFKRVMTNAGIDSGSSKGQGIKQFSKLSFHSLRHTFNSALANAGVDQEIRMAFTGHSTKAINSDYTHLDMPKLKSAISKLRSFET